MPNHVKFLAYHAILGIAFAIFFVLTLMVFNIANLRELLLHSDQKWLALFLFTFFMGLTFGSVQMGIAIMRLGHDDDDDDESGGGRKAPLLGSYLKTNLIKARVPVKTGR